MASRDKDPSAPHHHQPLLSSLVIRPSNSDGGAGAGTGGGSGGRDYESGEDIFPGYRIRAGSLSPVHRRDADHRYGSDYNMSRSRGYGGGRDPGRYRDPSPPYGRGRVGGRPMGRAFDGPGYGSGPFRGEGIGRNNPNVRPREGDWICPDPLCGNLNFARRDYCNNCNRSRHAPVESPRRGYPGPPPPPLHAPPRRFPGLPVDRSPERTINGFRSPPHGLGRDGPREYGSAAVPPLRNEGRFPDGLQRERMDYIDDAYRRNKFDRPPPIDWDHRDRGREGFTNERRRFERRPLSPPAPLLPALPPQRGRWARDVRQRSRSPIRGGPPKDMYMDRVRDNQRGGLVDRRRDRIGGMY